MLQSTADIDAFCARAKELGASDARIVTEKDLVASRLEKSEQENTDSGQQVRSIHWPRPIYPYDDIEEAIATYRWGILFKVCPKNTADAFGSTSTGTGDNSGTVRDAHRKVFEIAAFLESECFYKGYHLAMALASTDCREVFCNEEPSCAALSKGRACIHPYKARPSLQACGINPYRLAERVGWKLGKELSSDDLVPTSTCYVGLVLIT